MRLNGWQRLWVSVSVLYLIVLAGAVAKGWPRPEATPHRDEFIDRMPASRRAILSVYAGEFWANEHDAPRGRRITVPNGAVLVFPTQIPKDEWMAATQEYWNVVKAQAGEDRLSYIRNGFLAWAIPCAALYALGWAAGWVYRGFRPKPPQNA